MCQIRLLSARLDEPPWVAADDARNGVICVLLHARACPGRPGPCGCPPKNSWRGVGRLRCVSMARVTRSGSPATASTAWITRPEQSRSTCTRHRSRGSATTTCTTACCAVPRACPTGRPRPVPPCTRRSTRRQAPAQPAHPLAAALRGNASAGCRPAPMTGSSGAAPRPVVRSAPAAVIAPVACPGQGIIAEASAACHGAGGHGRADPRRRPRWGNMRGCSCNFLHR